MVERINLLLKAKNITARQFAEEIGIQPSGMSHILSGRNNPSLDFVMKVVKRWPEININWLMFGKGEMYTGVSYSPSAESSSDNAQSDVEQSPSVSSEQTNLSTQEYDLFSQPVVKHDRGDSTVSSHTDPVRQSKSQAASPSSVSSPARRSEPSTASLPDLDEGSTRAESIYPAKEKTEPAENRLYESVPAAPLLQPNLVKKRVVKVIVLYEDHSFAEYYPE